MSAKTLPGIAERVAAGATWLDRRKPGWVDQIDLDRLDIGSNWYCVLGQVFGRYELAPLDPVNDRMDRLLPEWNWVDWILDRTNRFERRARDYGFLPARSHEPVALAEAWRALILTRRAAA